MEFKNQEELLQMGLDAVPDDFDKSENSFIHQAISACSIIGHNLMIYAEFLHDMQYAENWSDSVLDAKVYDATGMVRREATQASGTVRFVGTAGTEIPQGTEITNGDVVFYTLYSDVIPYTGHLDIDVLAETAGDVGYLPVGVLNELVVPISGITSVSNLEVIANGYDAESDTSLRTRYYDYFRDHSATNNPSQFRGWAREVPGVGQARVVRADGGTGNVTVVLLDENYSPAGEELVEQVTDHITDQMGFDVNLSVIPAVAKPISLTLRLKEGSTADIEEMKTGAMGSIREELAYAPDPNFIRKTVNKYHLIGVVQNLAGAEDIEEITWNYEPETIIYMTDKEVPVLEEVEVIQ